MLCILRKCIRYLIRPSFIQFKINRLKLQSSWNIENTYIKDFLQNFYTKNHGPECEI